MAEQHKRGRGFAALDPDEQRRISSAGGRASHESGHAHEWSSAEAKEAGRRGGLAVHHHQQAEQALLHGRDENEGPSQPLPDDRGRTPRSNDEPAERGARSDEAYEDQLEPRQARGSGSEPGAEPGRRGDEERSASRSDERANEDVEHGASERSEAQGTARESI